MENKELHLKSPTAKKDKNKKDKTKLQDLQTTHQFEKPTEPIKRTIKLHNITVGELANHMALKSHRFIQKNDEPWCNGNS